MEFYHVDTTRARKVGGSPIDMVVNTRENKDISITAVQTISPTYNTIHFPFAASNAVEIALPNHISRQECRAENSKPKEIVAISCLLKEDIRQRGATGPSHQCQI